ncbi:MAG: ABC transporter ATP-binding protein [Treponema sp.]|nr:ABC transporter ATP-binding protein [Treponema sp.]
MEDTNAIELKNITKKFGSVVANNNINLTVKKQEILAILGENGSGKTTLMNMLSGIYRPDEGQIFINGKEAVIHSPKDANALKIGMIHQHYKLVNVFTAAENIILGQKEGEILDLTKVNEKIKEICDTYGFKLNPNQKIYEMSVSQKQTVEIIKVLYKGADILILDEPTAVLTPQETKSLFDVLRNMRKAGKSIIIITHKLNEVMEISDRVAILRKGEYIDTVETKTATTQSLTEMMVGEKISLDINRSEPKNTRDVLEIKQLSCLSKDGLPALDKISFTAKGGEILGIAAIGGLGVQEMFEAIAGIYPVTGGEIIYKKDDGTELNITNKQPRTIKKMGANIAFVPEDRLGMGLVGSMGMTDNVMLKSYDETKAPVLKRRQPRKLAQSIKTELEVVTPHIEYPVRRLSGGNVQKVLVGREISSTPDVLMIAYPVRGLDINSSYAIYNQLNAEKEKGVAVISIIEDLDVLLSLCDRIMVINNAHITGIVDARTTTKDQIGFLMTADKPMENQEGANA